MIPMIEHIKPVITRRTKAIITTIAIILNLLIIGFFLLVQLNLDDTSLTQHLRKIHSVLKKQTPKEEWAALSPKTSQLGAPVILMQAPQPATQQISQPHQSQVVQQQNISHTQQETPEQNNTLASSQDAQNTETQMQEIKISEPTQLVENIEATEKLNREEKQENNKASIEQAIKAALAKKLKTDINKTVQAQSTQANNTKTITHKQSPPVLPKTIQSPPQSTQQAKQQLTFAQLVKGFTEHLKREGEYTISMQGKGDAKATEHQLRVGIFLQKIIQCMQTSWKVNKNRYPLNHRVLAGIVVRVVINKDGSLNNLIVQKTSGRQIIDNYVLDILKDASKSFPPIPDYLKQEVCIITCNWEKIPLPEGPSNYIVAQ